MTENCIILHPDKGKEKIREQSYENLEMKSVFNILITEWAILKEYAEHKRSCGTFLLHRMLWTSREAAMSWTRL